MSRETRERHFLLVPSIWEQPWSEDARTVAFYLLTCRHRVTEGLYKLPLSYAAEDMGWDLERFREGFEELLADGFVEHDPAARMVLLVGALEIQAPANPNVDKAAIRALASFPPSPLFGRLHELAERFCKRFAKALAEAYPERIPKSPTPSPTPTPSPSPPPPSPPQAGGTGQKKGSRADRTNPRALALVETVSNLQPPTDDQALTLNAIRDEIKAAVSDVTWHGWLDDLRLAGVAPDGILILAVNDHRRDYVAGRFGSLIMAAARAHDAEARVGTADELAGLALRDVA